MISTGESSVRHIDRDDDRIVDIDRAITQSRYREVHSGSPACAPTYAATEFLTSKDGRNAGDVAVRGRLVPDIVEKPIDRERVGVDTGRSLDVLASRGEGNVVRLRDRVACGLGQERVGEGQAEGEDQSNPGPRKLH
jgi:hypothetical protein